MAVGEMKWMLESCYVGGGGIIGYVQNGYYPIMKYSIRILRKIRGGLLSSQTVFDF